MQLPDFRHFDPFNRLKDQMGIPQGAYGSIAIVVAPAGLTREELDKLGSGAGIDVTWDQITTYDDRTFGLRGEKIVLYIRDFDDYGRGAEGPRYHLMTCRTIVGMREAGRIQRYVAATEPNGLFVVNVRGPQGLRQEHRRLKVCWNCMMELNVAGFRSVTVPERRRMVDEFSPAAFFARYPRSLHQTLPTHGAEDAPLNVYSEDFSAISRAVRDRAQWRCEDCGRVLAEPGLKKYLQVHHRDGDRSNNAPTNLKVLCIGCHAEQPSHRHIKGTRDYQDYLRIRPPLPFAQR
jgi:hypothetical protein